ncbi:hypothetical protein A0H81_11521 [Grifola frondosa]|uniref:EKC/KEOPS complex subunit GON7 n=1 Tax=Grifola frondosa TaxID=5627 RepID=A0A1C7LW12_GRIFR|nr:hypothetical protein A0H81_11521 [Grifola frondosa]
MAAPAISITYELHPPPGTSAPQNCTSTKDHEFIVQSLGAAEDTLKNYYEGLRQAIAQAKGTLGEELTAWRDAVGSGEQSKEVKVKKGEDEEELDEDEE